jgi:hypothetical protein
MGACQLAKTTASLGVFRVEGHYNVIVEALGGPWTGPRFKQIRFL